MSEPAAIEVARANAQFSLSRSLRASAQRSDRDPTLLSEIGMRFHTLGIVALLADADRSAFARLLALSGQTELHCHGLDLSEHPRITMASRWIPLADTLAAGDLEGARRLSQLASDTCQEGYEYEDDFLRSRFLHILLLTPDDEVQLTGLLERWDQVTHGRPTSYHALSCALLARDRVAFTEAMARVLSYRRMNLLRWRKTPGYRAELDATEGSLFVLGLAYLRMADLRGIPTIEDYEAMPGLARIPLGASLPASGSWRVGAVGA